MTIITLLKISAAMLISAILLPQGQAQVASQYQQVSPNYYQQMKPSYYYGYNPYQYPQYPYQYQQPQRKSSSHNCSQPVPQSTRRLPKAAAPKVKSTKAVSSDTGWLSDYDTAWATAVKQGKPMVALFVHHGCPECDRMDAALAQPGAQQALDSAVKVRIEFTSDPATVARFGVKLTPTFLVLSPAHNGEVYREVGALSVERLRQLQPSIDSLVSAPAASTKDTTRAGTVKADSKARDAGPADDEETSRTVAAL